MTVPGVNVIVAATFMAAVGDIRRFGDRRKLTAYLGLDPRVRQSGAAPANHGHISKQGSNSARHALVEACWSTVRQPAPITAFYQRIRARRGHSIAIVAAARKLACLFWCLLTRGEDYAYAQPSRTQKKMPASNCRPAPRAGRAAATSGRPTAPCATPNARSPHRPSSPTDATSPTGKPPGRRRRARVRHRGTHLESLEGLKPRGRPQPRTSALRFVSHPRPTPSLPPRSPRRPDHLTSSVVKRPSAPALPVGRGERRTA
jgi:transposase